MSRQCGGDQFAALGQCIAHFVGLFAAGFGFYCFALRQDAGTVRSRSWI